MISLQYRVGPFGFLELSEIAGPEYAGSGNNGIRATMELGVHCKVLEDPLSALRMAWDGVPFDGIAPSVAQAAAFLSDNGTRN